MRTMILLTALAVAAGTALAGHPALSDRNGARTDPRVVAFDAFTRTPDVAELLIQAGLSADAYTPAEAVDVLIAEGERRLAAGDVVGAIPHYHLATAGAQSIDAVDDLAFLRHRLGVANWSLYRESGEPAFARLALMYWTIERDLYAEHDYPAIFRMMADYDIGRAHVALAEHDRSRANLVAATEAFGRVTAWAEHHGRDVLPLPTADRVTER